jgi:hypothetical protein
MRSLCAGAESRIASLRARRLASQRPRRVFRRPQRESNPMTDILLLALGLGIFALLIAYAAACEKV